MLAGALHRLAASDAAGSIALAGLLGVSSRFPMGTNIYDREWDLLVVLDTCRVDALRQVAPEFDFLDEIDAMWSVGSATREWAANTYTRAHSEDVAETALVLGNGNVKRALDANSALEPPFARRFTRWDTVDPEDFAEFDFVAGYAPHEPYGGLVTPDVMTDRAIAVGRETAVDRLVVHYIAPHNPYRARPIRENRPIEDYEYRPFRYLRQGGDRELAWGAYLDELRWVLEYVECLLENVDAETAVITADHGDLFGEHGLYNHPTGVPHPSLRRVPWAVTTATDTGSYEPHFRRRGDRITADVSAQLERLGYR